MKWFKHENTFNNPKIILLTDRHGTLGYGVYFLILELLAEHIETNNNSEWGFLPETYTKFPEVLAKQLHIDKENLSKIIKTCYNIGLFEKKGERLYCKKILERCDRYTELLIKQNKKTVHKVVENVHKVVESTPRIEENRIDKKRLDKNTKDKIIENTLSYLQNIPENHLQDYIKELNVTKEQVIGKAKELHNYCTYKHKSYSNYKLFLWNALKRDFKSTSTKYKVGVVQV